MTQSESSDTRMARFRGVGIALASVPFLAFGVGFIYLGLFNASLTGLTRAVLLGVGGVVFTIGLITVVAGVLIFLEIIAGERWRSPL